MIARIESAASSGRAFTTSSEAIDAVLTMLRGRLAARTIVVASIDRAQGTYSIIRALDADDGCGLTAGLTTPLAETLCVDVVQGTPRARAVDDALADPALAVRGLVRDYPIRAYAGAPLLRSDGSAIGTICALDPAPRIGSADDLDLLVFAARTVAGQIEQEEAERTRRQAEWRLTASAAAAATRALVEADLPDENAPNVLEMISESLGWEAGTLWQRLGWDAGALWSVDPENDVLRCVEVWNAPWLHVDSFAEASWRGEFARGVELPGRVWASGEPLWIMDVQSETGFPRAAAAVATGLHGAFAFPIRSGSDIIGVMEFFSLEARDPETDLLGLMGTIAGQVSHLIERQRAEDAIRDSEARKAAILEAALDCIITMDHEGRILEFNPAAEKTFDHRQSDVIGQELAELIIMPALRDEYRRWLADYLATGQGPLLNKRIEAAAVRRDGSELPIEMAIMPIRQRGKLQFTVYLRDITDRKRAEEQLRETLSELDVRIDEAERARSETLAVLDAASEAMVLVTPDRRFASVNRSFAEMFGIPQDEILERSLDETWPHLEKIFADPIRFQALVTRASKDDEQRFEEIVTQHWPERRELALFSTPVHSADGGYLGRLYVFRDVTREREVDRMKTEFVSLVSHELRTPLTSIKGYVDLLIEGEAGDLSEDQQAFLTIIKNNADRLVGLINDLLDVSRIEAGKIELNRTALDLVGLVGGVVHALRPQVEKKHQQLTLDLASDLPAAWGDADRVIQIVTNLVSNAHKYTPVGGKIEIRARVEGDHLRIDVKDTGVGMSEEEQAQVFAKFFRARNRATQEAGGTGLGLAITRALVEMHGGEIGVISEPSVGSTFSFTLPITIDLEGTRQSAPSGRSDARQRGGRVLVVEDEANVASLVRRYLERGGYEVLIAHNGTSALQLARAERPDLITLDVLLPGADGFTVLEWLKSDSTTADIPVVLLSIVSDTSRGKLLGAVDYITKPIDERALIERVGTILHEDRQRLVLVADDDADTRTMLTSHLRRAGYEIVEAANGAEAIEVARREQPDLALIDVKMPEVDGIAALSALRSNDATRDIRVVMMTACRAALEDNRSIVDEIGGAALLEKPCTAEELAAAIARGLASGNAS